MATTNVVLAPREWKLLSSTSAQVQVLGQAEVFVTESESLPANEDVYTILNPRRIYTYQKRGAENLYGFCENGSEVSVTANL